MSIASHAPIILVRKYRSGSLGFLESLTSKLDSGFEMYLANYISKPCLATRCKFMDAPKTLIYLCYRVPPSYLPYTHVCK